MSPKDTAGLHARFEATGFVVLRAHLDPTTVAALGVEMRRELVNAFGPALDETPEVRPIDGYYLPLMHARASVTSTLIESHTLVTLAAELLGAPVFVDPVSPGVVSFYGRAPWHRDADDNVPGVKIVSYQEALRAGAGAIHLSRGSHYAVPTADGHYDGRHLSGDAEEVVDLDPGDVLAFDLRTWHANPNPIRRTQWTTTYLRRPHNDRELAALLGWLAEGASYDRVEPLPNGQLWLDPAWVADPAPSPVKAHWLEELASFGRIPPRTP